MVVVFFPTLPFVGVMLFPSFWQGNAPGEGGASLALLSLFLVFSSSFFFLLSSSLFFLSSLLFFPSFLICFSFSSFCLSSLSLSFFLFSPYHTPLSCLLLIMSFSFVPLFSSFLPITLLFPVFFSFCLSPLSLFFFFFLFFLRELLVLSAFQDVIEDTTDCNRMRFI